MTLCINQSGVWRNITTQCVNQSSTWRKVVDGCVNQSGTWRCYGMSAPTVSISVSPTSIIRSGGEGGTSTLSWSSTGATAVVSSSNFTTSSLSGSQSVGPSATTTYGLTVCNTFGQTSGSATLTVSAPTLGSSFGGGRLICRASNINWIVAPSSSEVSRSWFSREDANTRAQQVTGCSGWFVPSRSQLRNPGCVCKNYWDSYSSFYWTSEFNSAYAYLVCMNFYPNPVKIKGCSYPVRSFRCVTY